MICKPDEFWGQAERTDPRKRPISDFNRWLSPVSERANESCDDAAPVSPAPRSTSTMLHDTRWVPEAASCTLREISSVAASCCSTAAAIAAEISDGRSIVVLM
jgi:hypothetical protein